jgi:hypothetical protein
MATLVKGELYEELDGQLLEIKRQLRQPNGYPYNPMQLRRALQDVIEGRFGSSSVAIIGWHQVYEKLGLLPEIEKFFEANVVGETCEDEQTWAMPVLAGATPNKVVAALRKLGVNVYTYVDDLDKSVTKNDRDPNKTGSYRVRFKKTVEADPELANKSAEDLKKEKVNGITLLERLLLELGYFLVTGEHLDIENVTLCSGSRNSDGGVPGVGWSVGTRGLCIDWYSPRRRSGSLRARAAV